MKLPQSAAQVLRKPVLVPTAAAALFLCLAMAPSHVRCSEPAALPRYQAETLNPDLLAAVRSPDGHTLLLGTDAAMWRKADGAIAHESTEVDRGGFTASTLRAAAFGVDGRVGVAVGEEGTLLRSTDGGRRWLRVPVPTASSLADVLAWKGAWIVAAGDGSLLRSEDEGQRWVAASLGVDVAFTRLFAAADGRLWALGQAGTLAVSGDEGRTWRLVRSPSDAPPLRTMAEGDGVLLVGTGQGRMLRSSDGGRSWTTVQTPATGFTEAMLYLRREKRWVAVTHDGVSLWSGDGGRRWQAVGRPLGTGLTALHHDAERGLVVAVGHAGVVQRSRDGGRSWQRQQIDREAHLLGLASVGEGLLAYGRFGVLARSDARAERWELVREPVGEGTQALTQLPGAGSLLAAGTAGSMLRSADGGSTWQRVQMSFVVAMYPTDFRVMKSLEGGNGVLAAGPTASIMRSDDAGVSWRSVMHQPFESAEVPVDLLRTRSGAWLAPQMGGVIDRSLDTGRTWLRLPSHPVHEPGQLTRTGAVSAFDGSLLLVGKGDRIWRSEDDGLHWQGIALPGMENLFALLSAPDRPSWWLSGSEGALLRSDDGGLSWRRLAIAGEPVRSVLLNLSRTSKGSFVVAGRDGVIARSEDGEHWVRIDSGTRADLRLALHEPGSGRLVLVGRAGMVLRCLDEACERWERLATPTKTDFRAAQFMPDGSLVMAGDRLVRLRREAEPAAR